jgi:hypothetical protein
MASKGLARDVMQLACARSIAAVPGPMLDEPREDTSSNGVPGSGSSHREGSADGPLDQGSAVPWQSTSRDPPLPIRP